MTKINAEFWQKLRDARWHYDDMLDKEPALYDSDYANFYTNIVDLEDGYLEPTEENIKMVLDGVEAIMKYR